MQRLLYVVNPVSVGEVAARESWAGRLPRFALPAALAFLPPRLEATLLTGEDHAGWAMSLREPPDTLAAHPRRTSRRIRRVVERVITGGAQAVGLSDGLGGAAGLVGSLGTAAGLAVIDGWMCRLHGTGPLLKAVLSGTGRVAARAEVLLLGGTSAAGRIAAFAAALEVNRLTLWGRSAALERLAQHLRHETGLATPCTEDEGLFSQVDTVIIAGRGPVDPALPRPATWIRSLAPRTCVIDLCSPYLIDQRQAAARPDVLVVQGCGYQLPPDFAWEGSFYDEGEAVLRRAAPPALAESLALTAAQCPELGAAGQEPTRERLRLLARVLDDLGFVPAHARAFGAVVTPEYLEAFRPPRPRWSCSY